MVSQVLPLDGEDEFDRLADLDEAAFRDKVDADDIASSERKAGLPGDMGQGAHATSYQLQGGYAPPAPTGGHPYWVAYYFTINTGTEEAPIYTTVSREVLVPGDAVAECRGNTVVIHHEGVADTFRIGRVRPA